MISEPTREFDNAERTAARLAPALIVVLLAGLQWALGATPARALESDRQQPLYVNADATGGSLGDGVTTLRGKPAFLEQEIEEQGLVQAEALVITYEVGSGVVELTGAADVKHPQYQISGEALTYDLNTQHFRGTGTDSEGGRIRIQLDPEVAPNVSPAPTTPQREPETEDASEPPAAADPAPGKTPANP